MSSSRSGRAAHDRSPTVGATKPPTAAGKDGPGADFDLKSLVHARWTSALSASPPHLQYQPPTATTSLVLSTGFRITLSLYPHLLSKPQNHSSSKASDHATAPPKTNPFLPPSPRLLISSNTPSGYNLVLNRFPLVPYHFLLATSPFQPQSCLLEDSDLDAIEEVLHRWSPPGRLFAFFNSSAVAGGSQPHRHVQFLPIEEGRRIWPDDAPRGAKEWRYRGGTPFAAYITRFEGKGGKNGEAKKVYPRMMRKIKKANGKWWREYNMAMTKDWMVVMERKSVDGGREGVGINGLILMGEVVVKTREDYEWFLDDVEAEKGRMEAVLGNIGTTEYGAEDESSESGCERSEGDWRT